MNLGNINLITPPDRLFNINLSYLLIHPSTTVKMQFQKILSRIDEDINVYVFEDSSDIEWLLSISQHVDSIIVDIDNSPELTKKFYSYILAAPNTYYLTTDTATPWKLINRHQIANLDFLIQRLDSIDRLNGNEDDDDD